MEECVGDWERVIGEEGCGRVGKSVWEREDWRVGGEVRGKREVLLDETYHLRSY